MPRSHVSHRRHSSSFTKFVTRFQRTFSSKNIKASTPIVPTQSNVRLTHPAPVPVFPSFVQHQHQQPRCRLSQILYDPHRAVEYLSDIDERSYSEISEPSNLADDSDSCYDSMSDHRPDQFNLSQMNVSVDNQPDQRSRPMKLSKPLTSSNASHFHSTAIHEIDHF